MTPQTHQHALAQAIAELRTQLEQWIGTQRNLSSAPALTDPSIPAQPSKTHTPTNANQLDKLCTLFALSTFERKLLLGTAAQELESSFADLYARAHNNHPYPTFALFLTAFPDAHWDAIAPSSPLRAWHLIKLEKSDTLVSSRLTIDERILHYLLGVPCSDESLPGLCHPLPAPRIQLPASQEQIAQRAAAAWADTLPILQFTGADPNTRETIATAAAAHAGLNVLKIAVTLLPTSAADLHTTTRLLDREAALGEYALLFPLDELEPSDTTRAAAIRTLTNNLQAAVILTAHDPQHAGTRPTILYEVTKPNLHEQRLVWEQAIGPHASSLNGSLDLLSSHFHLSAETIHTHSRLALSLNTQSSISNRHAHDLASTLWTVCRTQSRARLDQLAQRVASDATWDDLVLPPPQMTLLHTIAAQMRHRLRVHDTWGFRAANGRGLGIAALFSGISGTGKTTAAEILANELNLDLYRIDLSHTVSKYIGETEKNLRRIFDAAEEAGAVLLFDEADALFGKRTEVRDSHDRYANTEVSYLLQRMELYRGLAILATNMKQAIDPAFLRRIRFVISFPFPDQAMREAIWRRTIPAQAPLEGIDYANLSRLSMTGGNIRNIALNAAFAAADTSEPIRMSHLREAARAEAAKLERPLAEHEIRGWS